MRLSAVIVLLFIAAGSDTASRPQEWKAINYAPRGHPYFRMLYDWFTKDAATGLEVRTMADADLATLHRSGFNAVHLYLWDQPTFDDFHQKHATKIPETSGFAYPDPTLSASRQWEALDEFIGMAEKHNIWVLPHFVHMPFNDDLDSLSKTQVEQRAGARAALEFILAVDVTRIAPVVQGSGDRIAGGVRAKGYELLGSRSAETGVGIVCFRHPQRERQAI